jgi:hypothetical protein
MNRTVIMMFESECFHSNKPWLWGVSVACMRLLQHIGRIA